MKSHIDHYLNDIDARIAERNLLKHPFYQAWTMGTLTIYALQDYAKQYYHHVAAFPTYLSAVHSHTEDQPTRRHILQNLIDEEAGHPNHPELWLQFAKGLGVAEQSVKSVEHYDETDNLIATFRDVCANRDTVAGLAALYAYESQIPAICESKIDGLKKHYSMTDPQAWAYFSVHIEADKEHSAVERNLLRKHLTDHNVEMVNDSVDMVLDSLWYMLSGVCHRNGIAC